MGCVHPPPSPLDFTMAVLCLKWVPAILRLLAAGDRRFNQLQAAMPGISHKVLTDQLRVLQHVGIIHREAKARTYRRVHYDLTEAGQRLLPIIEEMEEWGQAQQGVLRQTVSAPREPAGYEPRRA
jgi:DNA-binding HxlR family transcriptional regulator